MITILHVGWWTSEFRGGGSIFHVEALMKALHERGADNSYFCGGRYNLFFRRPYIKKWLKEFTKVYELVNSPNLIWSNNKVESHIYDEYIGKLFTETIALIKPDIIHFHELESLSGCLLPLARKLKIPYLIDIHNYWYLCPQRDLMDQDRSNCQDYASGFKCTNCRVLPSSSKAGWMYIGYFRPTIVGRICDKFVSQFHQKRIEHEIYTNSKPDPEFQEVGTLYKERRAFFVAELNKSGAILFPSKRTQDVYRNYGVANAESHTLLPLNANFSIIERKQFQIPVSGEIVFGFIGGVLPQKGVHVLLEAFHLLQKDNNSRCKLVIYGDGDRLYEEKLKQKKYENVFFKGRYLPEQINDVLKEIHIAVVPSLWEDCSPIVLSELRLSKTPIIGSKIGGIEEVIQHGKTGFLFEPANIIELARYMLKFILSPELISEFMAAENFSFNIDDYMRQLLDIYHCVSHPDN